MKIDVSEELIDMLSSLDKDVAPRVVLEALKWASENPDRTQELVEDWRKMRSRGKSEFQWRLSIGNINPAEALDYAMKYEARKREEASLLNKVRSEAKKEGYTLSLPNGVQCRIQHKEGEYWFIFNVASEEVILFYSRVTYDAFEEASKYSQICTRYLHSIVYKDKVYEVSSQTGKALLRAIEQNIHPNIAALISP